MASILKVNTIQDATNSNTAMTIDSSGNTTMAGNTTVNGVLSGQINGGYELIASKVSTSHNEHANGSRINFSRVFSNAYIQYKVILGWYCHAGSSGEDLEFRFMTSGTVQVSSANYRWVLHRTKTANNAGTNRSSNSTKANLFYGVSGGTNEANVGVHGEITIMNVGDTTVGGVNTARTYSSGGTDVYAPVLYSQICGFSTDSSDYEKADGFCRQNASAREPYNITGFCFLTPSEGEAAGTHISVYGLRSA